MKILLTGAHFTPAQAVIEEFQKQPDIKIVYVGRKTTQEGDKTQSIESKVLPSLGVKFIPIITGRLQRTFTIYTIPSLLKIPIGFLQALFIVLSEKPDVVLSFGGYVSVPVVIAAWLLSVPIITHEQTLVSGLANRINSIFADKVAVSFDQNLNFSKPVVLTGNPLRKSILINETDQNLDNEYLEMFKTAKTEKLPVVLVTGGNQGSHIINLTIEGLLDNLTKIACVIHATGDNRFRDFERLEIKKNNRYLVKKWIGEEWSHVLSKTNLVISRAGINTLSELAFLKKPALLIPLPHLYQDEQNKNAKYFENLGLVKILPQSKLSPKSLFESIKEMLSNLDVWNKKAKDADKVIIPDAAKRLALETILLVK